MSKPEEVTEAEKRAMKIIDALDIQWRKRSYDTGEEWPEPRCHTAWGSKTKIGLARMIVRIMTEET